MSSVDVVVPCYCYGRFLRGCVQSVLTQSSVQIRVLILDDASPDNTKEIATALAREDPRVTFVRHEVNKGHIATYNEGIDWASADYFLLLSADDYLLPGALERAADLLDSHQDVGLVIGHATELRSNGETTAISDVVFEDDSPEMTLKGDQFIDLCFPCNVVVTATAVVRTALQKRVGGYRADLPHAGDLEMWLRLAAHASVGVLNSFQAVCRRHGNNMSDAYFQQCWLPDIQQRILVIDRFMGTCGHLLDDADRVHRRMLRDLSQIAVGFASRAFNEGDLDLSRRIEEMALDIFAGVRMTPSWWRLACKRTIGLKGWRVVQPTVEKVRSFAKA